MGQPVSPTPWMTARFGDHAADVMAGIAAAGRSAHERALDAKAGSQLDTNEAYGSFWKILPEELLLHLSFLPDRELIKPAESPYRLVVFGSTLVFPARCATGSQGIDQLKLGWSRFRERVFALHTGGAQRERGQLHFDLDEDLPADAADGTFGSAEQVLLVAYDCSPGGGLAHIYVGDATLARNGRVTWDHREELPLHLLDGEGADLVGLDRVQGGRFDDAPLPDATLTLRPLAPAATTPGGARTAGAGSDGRR